MSSLSFCAASLLGCNAHAASFMEIATGRSLATEDVLFYRIPESRGGTHPPPCQLRILEQRSKLAASSRDVVETLHKCPIKGLFIRVRGLEASG